MAGWCSFKVALEEQYLKNKKHMSKEVTDDLIDSKQELIRN